MKFYYHNEYCNLEIETRDAFIKRIRFIDERIDNPSENEFVKWFIREMDEYFRGERKLFHFTYYIEITDFQTSILEIVKTVRYGRTRSYGEIARIASRDKAVRAVARAIATNPVPILIPCHRIIKKNGEAGGYQGGTKLKEHLLEIERNSLK